MKYSASIYVLTLKRRISKLNRSSAHGKDSRHPEDHLMSSLEINTYFSTSRIFLYRFDESAGSVGIPTILSLTNLTLSIGDPF